MSSFHFGSLLPIAAAACTLALGAANAQSLGDGLTKSAFLERMSKTKLGKVECKPVHDFHRCFLSSYGDMNVFMEGAKVRRIGLYWVVGSFEEAKFQQAAEAVYQTTQKVPLTNATEVIEGLKGLARARPGENQTYRIGGVTYELRLARIQWEFHAGR